MHPSYSLTVRGVKFAIIASIVVALIWVPIGHSASAVPLQQETLNVPQQQMSKELDGTLSITYTAPATVTAAFNVFLPMVAAPPEEVVPDSWAMAGANLQRTSWVAEQVPSAQYLAAHRREFGNGQLYPQWYRPFEPFINAKIQVIAAHGLLYISTARGLYALRANNGDIAWIYPTALPLGHSPTVVGNSVYVGGYDHKIHALNALTGEVLSGWASYEAGAGFETNPLVVGGVVYAGNRDGYFYALSAYTGELVWRYKTAGPILYSAAYKDGIIYFASNDSHAYAVNTNGQLVWKSAKLPGGGFHSYWPVVYQDYVIFSGAHGYKIDPDLRVGTFQFSQQELADVYPNHASDPAGTMIGSTGRVSGDWVNGTLTIDDSRATQYFESKPWRRTYFVLNRATGQEYSFDSDGDGKSEYAPILWVGTHSGNKYPPVIGKDGVLYQFNNYLSDPYIAGGQISGWKFGTKYISIGNTDWGPVDEPHCASAGGNLVYWEQWWGNAGGAFDISVPVDDYSNTNGTREWHYYDYNLGSLLPGVSPQTNPNRVYGHQTLNCPIPYQGMVYTNLNGSIVAWGQQQKTPVKLPLAQIVATATTPATATLDELKQRLVGEVQKMLNAGHLRPGYHAQGLGDFGTNTCCRYLSHYFSNSSDTLYALIRALPHLPASMQAQVRTYLQQEYAKSPPHVNAHMGWKDGAPREVFDLLPEVEAKMAAFGPLSGEYTEYWTYPQYMFYGLWKYAQEFGGAKQIFDAAKSRLESPPSDSYFQAGYTHILNAYIAGYTGYLNLQVLAGYQESVNVRATLNHLLDLSATNFSKDHPAWSGEVYDYMDPLNISRNFMYLVPEHAAYLRAHALSKVQAALAEYQTIAPYWFVSKYDSTRGEGVFQQLFDYHALFQAKALILMESRSELVKYLDVPAFDRGDLFYIHNLISAIEAAP